MEIDIIKLDESNFNTKIKELCSTYGLCYNNIYLNSNSSNSDYNEYLNNKYLVNHINFIYKKDFELYNYEMIKTF